MLYFIDIDNTICETRGRDYPNSKPIQKAIDKVNTLYDKGNVIVMWTSRGTKSGLDWHYFTVRQLSEWGLKYHKLMIIEKPDVIIDDKAINARDWLNV